MPASRLPEWLRKPQTRYTELHDIKRLLRAHGLHTVCEAARCPNIHECFHRRTATFLILGNRCTRRCGFCAVPGFDGGSAPPPPDPAEPAGVAAMAASLGLRHVVITSVTRDDLPDGGAAHFAAAVRAVRAALPEAVIEVLTPDFRGEEESLDAVLRAGPDVFNHNLETVPRLYPAVRPQAVYERSLTVLALARRLRPGILVKSGLMAGLGERPDEVEQLLRDLAAAGASIATIGQYLQPGRGNLPVASFVSPAQFDAYREAGLAAGLKLVFSGPLVRSSYMADMVHRSLTGREPGSRC